MQQYYLCFMAKKHILQRSSVSSVDKETGEITHTEVTKLFKINIGRQEEFYMTYCNYLSGIYQLSYADDIKLLVKLCEWGQYDTGMVSLTASKRKELATTINMHQSNISKSIKRLKDKKLISGDNGDYQLNPAVFWKGDRAIRKQVLKKKGLNVIFNFNIEEEK
jgi:hypothetical protein